MKIWEENIVGINSALIQRVRFLPNVLPIFPCSQLVGQELSAGNLLDDDRREVDDVVRNIREILGLFAV